MPAARAVPHSSVTSTRARLGGVAIGFAGVAFALVQILQQTVGAFEPRPIVTPLIAITVGLAGLTLERWRHVRARSRVLATELRDWPLRSLAATDPLALGVFPPPGAAAGAVPGAYVARDADGAVRAALDAGGLVVVVGPARAGKSRTASEVAHAALGDRTAVVPVGAGALAALLTDGSFTPPADAVWWLDDLERFSGALDGPSLDRLLDGRLAVATVRREAWDALLAASGDEGEVGRRLAAAARVVELAATASAGERERAAELHPGLELTPPVGVALAGCTGAVPPAGATAMSQPQRGERRDRVLWLGAAATAASAGALALVVAGGGWSEAQPPPLGAQVDAIRADAQRAGLSTILARPVHLHGSGEDSYLFVLRPRDRGSDELRIYDDRDGWLELATRFVPRTRGDRSELSSPSEEEVRSGAKDLAVADAATADVNGDGTPELVASYETPGRASLPMLVAWDDARGLYRTSPLVPARQAPLHGVMPGAFLGGTYALVDGESGERLRPGAVSAFRIVPAADLRPPRLVTAIAGFRGNEPAVALGVYELGLRGGRVETAARCGGGVQADGDPERILRRRAAAVARSAAGTPSADGATCVL